MAKIGDVMIQISTAKCTGIYWHLIGHYVIANLTRRREAESRMRRQELGLPPRWAGATRGNVNNNGAISNVVGHFLYLRYYRSKKSVIDQKYLRIATKTI